MGSVEKRLAVFGTVLSVTGYALLAVLLIYLGSLMMEYFQTRNNLFSFMSFIRQKIFFTALFAGCAVLVIAMGVIVKTLASLEGSAKRCEEALRELGSQARKG